MVSGIASLLYVLVDLSVCSLLVSTCWNSLQYLLGLVIPLSSRFQSVKGVIQAALQLLHLFCQLPAANKNIQGYAMKTKKRPDGKKDVFSNYFPFWTGFPIFRWHGTVSFGDFPWVGKVKLGRRNAQIRYGEPTDPVGSPTFWWLMSWLAL